MEVLEKEGGWPLYDTDILNFFFLPTAEMITWLTSKIGSYLPAAVVLKPR